MSYNATFSQEMNDNAKMAAAKFLMTRGHEIMDEDCRFDYVSIDMDENLVFTDVFLQGSLEEVKLSRARIERDMVIELMNHPDLVDRSVRYDTIIVLPLGKRALIKHHINAIGIADCGDDE